MLIEVLVSKACNLSAQYLLGVGSHADQEYAEVTNTNVLNPANEWQANDGQSGVEDDNWTSDMVLVTNVPSAIHQQTGGRIAININGKIFENGPFREYLRWSDQALRLG